MKYPLITAYFAGARHGFEIKTAILTVSWRERTNCKPTASPHQQNINAE